MSGLAPGVGELVVFEVPAAIEPEEILEGLPQSAVVPRLRGSELASAVTIVVESLSAASATAQLFIARDEISEFCRRLKRKLVPTDTRDKVTVRVVTESRSLRVDITANDSDAQFVAVVLEAIEPTPPA